ncbi:hypothetical protein LPB72_06250 [Hydrogenophaga crassostreae]|uniref:Uncharacterized protein n=1 Tax=Hydrogenophaga crassostreae TaxID=1763535 RepID=A0A162T306_9BURK|nr:hypothetical protein LPB072_16465 [Hydrogenophaga crassostreae]OAD42876.1 hypothetical protein LPB72_06250 [Hydrogenophaga crassostreae]
MYIEKYNRMSAPMGTRLRLASAHPKSLFFMINPFVALRADACQCMPLAWRENGLQASHTGEGVAAPDLVLLKAHL